MLKKIFVISIMASSINNAIGLKGKLPWKNDIELKTKEQKVFKAIVNKYITQHKAKMICGPKTYKSLGKKFRKKVHIVKREDLKNINRFIEIIAMKYNTKVIINIGGAWLYNKLLPVTKFFYVNKINRFYTGDVFFDINNKLKNNFELKYKDFWTCGSICISSLGYIKKQYIIDKWKANEVIYLKSLTKVLTEGSYKQGRTIGDSTISSLGLTSIYDITDHKVPILTSKKIFVRGIIEELLWFIRGETNVSILKEKGVNFWNANTEREVLDSKNLDRYDEYDAGPIYGFNFRHYGAIYNGCKARYKDTNCGVDQLNNAIKMIKQDVSSGKSSRRIIINLWNPVQLNEVALPPCHILYQFHVYDKNKLSCTMYQRSGDMILGVPFNIVSCTILTNILARLTGTKPHILTHIIADAHIYESHILTAYEQIIKCQTIDIIRKSPTVHVSEKLKDIDSIKYEDIKISDYTYTTLKNKSKMIVT